MNTIYENNKNTINSFFERLFRLKVAGAGVGIGLVFGSLIEATARNPSLRPQLFAYAILGFALAEATG
jgi:F-type H+-transporting ATPase subunit c